VKKLFESFRKFQLNELDDNYKFKAKLVINKLIGRNKDEILSDIRAVEGITIVKVENKKEAIDKDISILTIKLDTSPIIDKSLRVLVLQLQRTIKGIKGVQGFEFKGKAEII
jgi:hypothetical protein